MQQSQFRRRLCELRDSDSKFTNKESNILRQDGSSAGHVEID